MKAINTMTHEEQARYYFDACQRMCKKLARLEDEEISKSRYFDNKGNEEKALEHDFNARALFIARDSILNNENTRIHE